MQIDASTLILTIVNFLLLMVILDRLLYRPILRHMAQRQLKVEAGLAAGRDSQRLLEDARAQLEQEEKEQRLALQHQADLRLREAADQARDLRQQAEADLRRRRDAALEALREEQRSMTQTLSKDLPRVIERLQDRIDPAPTEGSPRAH